MATYTIPEVGGGIEPLDAPAGLGHAGLHDLLANTVLAINGRVNDLETAAAGSVDDIEQARLVANTWVVSGPVVADGTKVLFPVLWNLTGRPTIFEAAGLTVRTPPTATPGPLTVDLLLGAPQTTGSKIVNFDPTTMTKLTSAPLQVAVGDNISSVVTSFATAQQPVGTFVTAVIRGATGQTYGADLVIQLNRNL